MYNIGLTPKPALKEPHVVRWHFHRGARAQRQTSRKADRRSLEESRVDHGAREVRPAAVGCSPSSEYSLSFGAFFSAIRHAFPAGSSAAPMSLAASRYELLFLRDCNCG